MSQACVFLLYPLNLLPVQTLVPAPEWVGEPSTRVIWHWLFWQQQQKEVQSSGYNIDNLNNMDNVYNIADIDTIDNIDDADNVMDDIDDIDNVINTFAYDTIRSTGKWHTHCSIWTNCN